MPLYKQDPNDSTKQVPGSLPPKANGYAVIPDRFGTVKSPSYVLVNEVMTDHVGFYFNTSASFASLSTSNQSAAGTYTIMGVDLAAGTRLDIHPTAWSGSAADSGKLTFVYNGGLSTGGR